jgi:mRNA interferase MazF
VVSRKIERYGIYFANLDPTRGSEIAKNRPVIIVCRNEMNRFLDTVVACPLTTKLHPRWRDRIQRICAGRKAEIAIDQIRTVSKERLGKKLRNSMRR